MFLGRQKIINPLGHKTILGPSAQGWFCVLRWKNLNNLDYSTLESSDAIPSSIQFRQYLYVSSRVKLRAIYLQRSMFRLSRKSNLNPQVGVTYVPTYKKIFINSFTGSWWCNRRNHGKNIHPTENFISMNLLQMSCVITWAWSFLTSEVVEAVRGQKHHISAHTLAL